MKHDLGYWWPFAQTAWGWTVATAGGMAALYYGPRKVLETFDWYMDRFWDSKVQNFLESQITKSAFVHPGGFRSQSSVPKTVSEIAQQIGFSERRVRACLERLIRHKKVTREGPDSWRAVVPPHVQV